MDDLAAPYADLPPDRRALLEQLLQESGNEFNAFQLSFAQQRLWFLDQLQPGSPLYNLPAALRLSGPLDLAALRCSLAAIAARHEALRTTIITVAGQPMQRIAPAPDEAGTPLVDLAGLPERAREATAQRLAQEEARRPFDLARGPLLRTALLRLAGEEHLLLLTMHHIIADGWSIGVFVRDLAALYESAKTRRPAVLPELPIQYADYAGWQREWLQGEGDQEPSPLQAQLAYWRRSLAGAPSVLELPTDHPRPLVQTFEGAIRRFTLAAPLADGLEALSRRAGATLFMTLLTAFQVLLARYSGQNDIVVGTPIANRTRAELEGLIGCFVNTLVLRTGLAGNPRFDELLGRVRATCLDAYAHQDLPFEQLVEALAPARDLSHPPLVQVVFALQNAPLPALELAGLTLRMLDVDSGTAKFDLTLNLEPDSAGLRGWFEYNTSLFEAATITRLVGHFETLLSGLLANPARRVADVPLLTSAELAQIHSVWNASAADYPRHASVARLFEAQVARSPDTIAALYNGLSLSYAALNARANQLAHLLTRRGVRPDTLVALAADRSLEMLIAILAILKAGAAYLPLDPAYPAERIAFMLADSQAHLLITTTNHDGRWTIDDDKAVLPAIENRKSKIVNLATEWSTILAQPSHKLPTTIDSAQRAYVIYTSGSTGRPKGVMVVQRGLLNLVYGLRAFFDDAAVQSTGLITSISFDISVNQIFPSLLFGRTLHVIPDALKFDSPALLRYLRLNGIHLLDAVPSYLQAVLRDLAPKRLPTVLRYLLIGGEKLERALLEAIYGQLGEQVRVVNIYGLTELSDVNALAVLGATEVAQPITIGYPLQNNQLYIVNERQALQPIGVVGELCIGGESLSRGYLGRPDMTAERFIPNPFAKVLGVGYRVSEEVARDTWHPILDTQLVRTGDLGRWLADGRIELLGRRDAQVKVRGFRIEVGEVEAALARAEGVRAAVVLAREDVPGDTRLVAYVVPTMDDRRPTIDDGMPSEPSSIVDRPSSLVTELRAVLKRQLPEYMVPSAFVVLEALPTTPNGKLDRRALPPPDTSGADREKDYVAPRTPVEEVLASIWAQVLRIERVGIHDNFFELGGHSLLATQVLTRLRATFQVDLPLRSLFEATTVEELARIIVAREARPGQSEKIARVLKRLEAMSAEDARALLAKKEQQASLK